MMQISFEQDQTLPSDTIDLVVRASSLTPAVNDLINQLQQQIPRVTVLPVTHGDQVLILTVQDIVAIEVLEGRLTVHTAKEQYSFAGQLTGLLARLGDPAFVRISRSAALNLSHLYALETEFSGNMTAKFDNGLHLTVSRQYLPGLKQRIGM